jgi:hypothetical protein
MARDQLLNESGRPSGTMLNEARDTIRNRLHSISVCLALVLETV